MTPNNPPHMEKIKKIFQEKSQINLFFLLYKNPSIKIIEKPNFHTGAMEYHQDIYLRQYCFTGLKGALSWEHTADILQSKYKKEILEFLSIFSGRLLQLRSNYTLKFLPHPHSHSMDFLQTISGFNRRENLPITSFISKNKNINNLKYLLELLTAQTISIEKYYIISVKHQNAPDRRLGFLCLGTHIPIPSIKIIIFCNSYGALIETIKKHTLINNLIEFYTTNFIIKFSITKTEILLKNYYLSSKITFK